MIVRLLYIDLQCIIQRLQLEKVLVTSVLYYVKSAVIFVSKIVYLGVIQFLQSQ